VHLWLKVTKKEIIDFKNVLYPRKGTPLTTHLFSG
jgi:hypothetical protein